MSLEYDLVIIGNTLEASYAALKAAQLQGRVALVLGERETNIYTEVDVCTFNYLNYLDKHWQNLTQWELNPHYVSNLNIPEITSWTTQVKEDIKEYYSPAMLAAEGVDVIMESGEFCRLPKLGFVIKNRTLRSRNYLLAMGTISSIPNLEGLSEVGYLTIETLNLDKLPQDLIIVSQTPRGIELAQNLNRLGKEVTLVVEDSNILPQEEPDLVQLLQAQLEADGIKLLVNCPITQVRKIEDKKWIQAGNQALETEEIILISKPIAKIKGLNLQGVKIEIKSEQIRVNNKLQTSHPRIYACGSIIRGYSLSNLDKYEANIAVKNAIFYPIFKVDYNSLPCHLFTHPILSRVGLTESQARQSYGDDIIVIKQNYKTLAKAQILDETTGFCKIITRRNGIILGGHIIGNNSDELINLIALAIKNKIKIQQFSEVFPPSPTISEILFEMSESWQYQKLQENKFLNNCLETLLFWRRKWNL